MDVRLLLSCAFTGAKQAEAKQSNIAGILFFMNKDFIIIISTSDYLSELAPHPEVWVLHP